MWIPSTRRENGGESRPKTGKGKELATPSTREKRKKKSQGCDDLIKKQLRIPCAYKVTLLMGMQIGAVLLENSSAVSYKAKHIPYDPAVPRLQIYPVEMKVYAHECRSFIHYCPKLKTTGMFFSG